MISGELSMGDWPLSDDGDSELLSNEYGELFRGDIGVKEFLVEDGDKELEDELSFTGGVNALLNDKCEVNDSNWPGVLTK